MYMPTIGRFATRDPINEIELGDGGHGRHYQKRSFRSNPNPYRYCGNKPVIQVDPDGRQAAPPEAPKPSKITIGSITYIGCSEEQIKQIQDAGHKVYNEVIKNECLKGTGLEECFNQLFGRSPMNIYCDKDCEKPNEGGWFEGSPLVRRPDPCKCYGQTSEKTTQQNLPIYIGICTDDKGNIPRKGYTLEEILMHEMLHGCGLDHDGKNVPEWQIKMFDACLKKCFPNNRKYQGANPADCKCRDK